MQFELTKEMKDDIVKQATSQAVKAVMSSLNTKQIVQEVKNSAVKEAVKMLSEEMMKQYKGSELIIQSAEQRVNGLIAKRLENGIVVRFKGE